MVTVSLAARAYLSVHRRIERLPVRRAGLGQIGIDGQATQANRDDPSSRNQIRTVAHPRTESDSLAH
jgi:hypothetical protein